MKTCRVFLVDDHPLVTESLARKLSENEEINVVGTAENAEDALERVKALLPHLVVMDVQLPGMDGVEATRQLKAACPEIRVVIVSAYGEDYLVPCIQAGAEAYLLKTSPPENLVRDIIRAAQGEPQIDSSLTRHLLDQVSAYASINRGFGFSPRQKELLRLVAEGCSTKGMAARLFISEATVKREFQNIFNGLGVNDRAHAVAEAYRRKLI